MVRSLLAIVICLSAVGCAGASPTGTASPVTSATPSVTPTASAATPSSTASQSLVLPFLGDGPLASGTYRDKYLLPLQVTLTVPTNWAGVEDWALGAFDGHAYLALYRVQNLYADPCQWQGTIDDPPLGPTTDDLVQAMAKFPERSPTAPAGVKLAGRDAKMIEWAVPLDVDFVDCDMGQYRSWTKSNWAETDFGVRYHQAPGQVDRIYILDVAGSRLVVDETWEPTVTAAQRAELDAVVNSITIVEP